MNIIQAIVLGPIILIMVITFIVLWISCVVVIVGIANSVFDEIKNRRKG